MPQFLYDQNNITPEDLKCYEAEIQAILSGQLSQSKKLAGMDFHGRSIYRIKADKKKRLIFTYMLHEGQYKLLILNALEDHKYEDLKKRLQASTTSIVTKELDIQNQFKSDEVSESVEAVPYPKYNDITLVFDKDQHEAMQKTMPLLLTGVPGGGKTVVLFNLILSVMDSLVHLQEDQPLPVLFLSQSPTLIDELQEEYRRIKSPSWPEVQFGNWDSWIDSVLPKKQDNPEQKLTLATKDNFSTWLKQHWPNHPVPLSKNDKKDEFNQELHYELSLIQALGEKTYFQLGARQSYFSDAALKKDFIKQLAQWKDFLNINQLFDPLVSPLDLKDLPKFAAVFGDEFQNLPPLALFYFIKLTQDQRFVATIDIEQCIVSSPYNYVTLKQLMHQHYGSYSEYCLTRTWRCPPNIAEAASRLINIKHAHQNNRRLYSSIKSAQTMDGSILLIDEKKLNSIKIYGQSAKTVVLIDYLTIKIRHNIQSQISSNNILTTKEVIGLDFEVVILWEPISTNPDLSSLFQKWNQQKSKESKGIFDITLKEEQALSSLYVAITRAQKVLIIYETNKYTHFLTYLLGNFNTSPTISLQKKISEVEAKKQFTELAEHYIKEGKIDLAKEIMQFHLKLSETEIAKKLTSQETLATPKTDLPLNLTQVNNKPSYIKKRNRSNKARPIAPKKTPTSSKPDTLITSQNIKEANQNTNQHFEDFVNDLILNPSEDKLKILFSHKNAINYLFKKKLDEGLCLLSKLIRISSIHPIILPWLGPKTLFASQVNNNLMFEKGSDDLTTFTHLLFSKEGILFLQSWLLENRSFASMINTEFLNQSFQLSGMKMSLIHFLSTTNSITPILILLIKQNPEIAKRIMLDTAFFSRDSLIKMLTKENITFLYLMCISEEGIETLIQMLPTTSGLKSKLNVDRLCQKINLNSTHYSMFHMLTLNPKGLLLLHQLIKINADMAQNKIMHLLFEPYKSLHGFKSCLFFTLINHDSGIKFFLNLISINRDLVNFIKIDHLITTDLAIAYKSAQLTSLYNLARTIKGCELLSVLLQLKPELFTNMPLKVFQFNCEMLGPEYKSETILKEFFHHPQGITFLTQLLEQSPDFGKLITKQMLLFDKYDTGTLLAHLLLKKPGVKFLNTLLYSYPELITDIPPSLVLAPSVPLEGLNIKLPPSLYLSQSLEGMHLLQKIYPQINIKGLYVQLVKIYPGSEHSILFLLLKYKQLPLLESIFVTNSYLPEAINADLLLLNSSVNDESEHKSLHAQLVDYPELLDDLQTLLKKCTVQTDNAPNLSTLSKNINQFFTIPSFSEDTNEDNNDAHDAITEKLN